jgi:DNA-directed RNA polymerase specialized sigma24 family protein
MYAFPNTRWSLIATLPGQPHQVGTLVGIYADAIGAYLHTRLVGERAERIDDIVQEVLVDLLGKPEVLAKAQPGQGSKFRYYLMNLAWLGALNALRHHRRRDHAAPEAHDPDGEGVARVELLSATVPAPEQAAMDRAWAVGVMQGALDDVRALVSGGRLPADALQILVRNLVEGHALRDIAADIAMPVATCHRRCAHARAALQDAIAERLRLVGELGPDEDPAAACEVLLAAIAHG